MLSILFSIAILATYGYLVTKKESLALALIPALSPLYLIRLSLGPIPTTLLELIIVLALGHWLFSKPWLRIQLTKQKVSLLVLIGAVITIGICVATDTLSALGIAKAYYIEPVLLFLAMRDRLTKEDFRIALHALGITACLLGIFGVFQWITGLGLPIPYDFTRRITSVFTYPNAYGLFVTPVAALFGVLAWQEKNKAYAGLAAFLTLTLLLSQTEAGIVALLGVAGLFISAQLKTQRAKMAFSALCVAIITAALLFPFSQSKLLLQDYSGLVRRSQWQETAALLQDHPVFGVGFNAYPVALEPYHTDALYEIFQYPHNLFLNAWAEAGIVNVIFILILLGATLYAFVKSSKGEQLVLATSLALLAMFIHGLVDVPFYKNDLAVLTAFLFAILASIQGSRTNMPKSDIS